MSEAAQTSTEQIRQDRPVGVRALVIANVLYGFLLAVSPLQVILYPHLESWSLPARIGAPIVVLLAAGVFFSSIGVWLGSRRARTLLLVLLAIDSAGFVWDNIALIMESLNAGDDLKAMSLRGWWNFTVGVRAVLWFTLNYWYFRGSRAREFILSRSHGGKIDLTGSRSRS